MQTHKSIFTTILPLLCALGIVVLIFMWGKKSEPKKPIIIQGPRTAPTEIR